MPLPRLIISQDLLPDAAPANVPPVVATETVGSGLRLTARRAAGPRSSETDAVTEAESPVVPLLSASVLLRVRGRLASRTLPSAEGLEGAARRIRP